jgi:hypothetical protein
LLKGLRIDFETVAPEHDCSAGPQGIGAAGGSGDGGDRRARTCA